MIEIKFTMDEKRNMATLRVKGHAESSPFGQDLVCASASILAYTLAQNIKYAEERGSLKYAPKIKLSSGDAIITARAKNEDEYNEILKQYLTIQTGYQVLCHNYPQYVALEMFGSAE